MRCRDKATSKSHWNISVAMATRISSILASWICFRSRETDTVAPTLATSAGIQLSTMVNMPIRVQAGRAKSTDRRIDFLKIARNWRVVFSFARYAVQFVHDYQSY